MTIAPDGSIAQAECTSCGLNGGPLRADGCYPAAIACNLTNGHMPHITNRLGGFDVPYLTHEGEGHGALIFITNLKDGCLAAFKYFAFAGPVRLTVTTRGAAGRLAVTVGDAPCGEIALPGGPDWRQSSPTLDHSDAAALRLTYDGEGPADLLSIAFAPAEQEAVQ